MASYHNRKKRCGKGGGGAAGLVARDREDGQAAPPLRGAPLRKARGRTLPGTLRLRSRGVRPPPGPTLSPGSPWRGSLEVFSQVSSGNPAAGFRPGRADPQGAESRSLAFGAHGPGRGALRVKQGCATRRLRLACAPGRIPGGDSGPPTARPALHAAETDEKIKNPL